MGVLHDRMHSRANKRRTCWPVLELYLDVCWLHFRGDELSRDGINVSCDFEAGSYTTVLIKDRAPTSGGQYHWVSEFAPPEYQQFLSYVVGWMSTLSWQAGNAADCFLTGTIAQALIVVNNPAYEPQRWEGTLFVFAMVHHTKDRIETVGIC